MEDGKKQSDFARYINSVLVEKEFRVGAKRSVQRDELIIFFRPSLDRLKKFAEKIRFDVQIDPQKIGACKTISIPGHPDIALYNPCEFSKFNILRRKKLT
mmetsp:Transcript_10606/g.14618  ORF Transcript_10606/g.14618 Transcript_10606/m.14618 type:complete len:100 (-) Transcript_10606:3-302(-)